MPHAVLLRALMELPQGPSFSAVREALTMLVGACQWPSAIEKEWFLQAIRPVVEMFLDESSTTIAQRDLLEAKTCTFEKGTYGHELRATAEGDMEIDASDCVALSLDDEELLGDRVRRIECFVSNASPLVLWYWDKEHPVIAGALEGQLIRITKLAKRTTLNRMVSALHVLCEPPRRAKKKEGNIKERLQVQHAPSEGLKTILLPFPLTHKDRFALSKKVPDEKLLKGDEPTPTAELNFSQTRALNASTVRTVTLVQGPPGTGKTTTCVQVLRRWVMMMPAKRRKTTSILATSGSNIAVDNLVEGLVAMGINAVRLGRPEIMRPEVSRCVVENVAMRNMGVASFKDVPEKAKRKAIQEAMEEAQVICCTVVTAGSALLKDFRFPLVLVDEASQVTEPATLISICRGCQQLAPSPDLAQAELLTADRGDVSGWDASWELRALAKGTGL
ncbi:upf1 [Symbiodinium natans]|uniref:Upf1 protein n=1 Tax=Symbiodinium natans TaxID=878477 RepID=A0A812IZ65_9DINO|nr:upf1 [Symbiodinium natans]